MNFETYFIGKRLELNSFQYRKQLLYLKPSSLLCVGLVHGKQSNRFIPLTDKLIHYILPFLRKRSLCVYI